MKTPEEIAATLVDVILNGNTKQAAHVCELLHPLEVAQVCTRVGAILAHSPSAVSRFCIVLDSLLENRGVSGDDVRNEVGA